MPTTDFKNPHEIATQVVRDNYGPDGDPEVWAAALHEADVSRALSWSAAENLVKDKHLLDAALEAGHLDGDGILALIRAAAEAVRAQFDATSRLPSELNDRIDSDLEESDYSVYVLDGQTALHTEQHGPENDEGDCYHDALVLIDGIRGERAVRYIMHPNGSIASSQV